MGKLFRIEESDLADLEKTVPEIADALFLHMTPALRVKLRRVQGILSAVRWNYGPPSEVERIDNE